MSKNNSKKDVFVYTEGDQDLFFKSILGKGDKFELNKEDDYIDVMTLDNKNEHEEDYVNIEYLEGEDDKEIEHSQNFNTPVPSSPLYPRIYIGESAKPLQGQYHQSEYVDDNISRTWLGILSFYG